MFPNLLRQTAVPLLLGGPELTVVLLTLLLEVGVPAAVAVGVYWYLDRGREDRIETLEDRVAELEADHTED